MGRYLQEYPPHSTDRNPNFAEVERRAFDHVREQLAQMPSCGLYDLQSAAASYLSLFLGAQGFPMRREWIDHKAAKWAAWWDRKHTASRTPQPHTKYSPSQALRGRQVAAIRKRGQNDWTALRVQLARQGGL